MADTERELEAGDILVNAHGRVRVIRSRTAENDGWNCNDGAPISDVDASDRTIWWAFTPAELAADLASAAEVRAVSDQPVLAGGLRTWDACSGRPCILPKLADVARTVRNGSVAR